MFFKRGYRQTVRATTTLLSIHILKKKRKEKQFNNSCWCAGCASGRQWGKAQSLAPPYKGTKIFYKNEISRHNKRAIAIPLIAPLVYRDLFLCVYGVFVSRHIIVVAYYSLTYRNTSHSTKTVCFFFLCQQYASSQRYHV